MTPQKALWLLSEDAGRLGCVWLAQMYAASALRLGEEARQSLSERLAAMHRAAAEEFARRLRGDNGRPA